MVARFQAEVSRRNARSSAAAALHALRAHAHTLATLVACALLCVLLVTRSTVSVRARGLGGVARDAAGAGAADAAAGASDAEVRLMRTRLRPAEIWMDRSEVDVLLRHLSGARSYLEWGSGGSTLNYPQFVSGPAASIEHNAAWCASMPERLRARRAVDLRCVSVAHEGFAEGTYAKFRAYVNEIAALRRARWDFVLIDGRVRVPCALRALSYVGDRSVVVVHDFERAGGIRDGYDYRLMLRYYDVVERTGNSVRAGSGWRGLGVLRRKPRYHHLQGNHTAVLQLLEEGSASGLF